MSASNTTGEDKKAREEKPLINIKVQSNQGKPEVEFRLKRDSQLQRLMQAYCDCQSVALGTYVFLFDGKRIKPESTPHDLGMEDGDEIDAMLHQNGGGGGHK